MEQNKIIRDEKGRFMDGTKVSYWKGKKFSETHKKNAVLGRKNNGKLWHSEETIQKMIKNHKGMSGLEASEEWKKQKKESMIKYHKENKGTEEYKKRCENISKSKIGHEVSEKTRRKISKNRIGKTAREKNPNWQGGKSFEPYGFEFNNKFKLAIRKRDNQVCMLCGIHREKLSEALTIHHINYDKKLNIPQNCVSLCRKCHGQTNYNRKHWIKFFQDLLSKLYDYQYSESQEVILNLNKNNRICQSQKEQGLGTGQ